MSDITFGETVNLFNPWHKHTRLVLRD